jgi:exodeoxyribonuclease VII small subunit
MVAAMASAGPLGYDAEWRAVRVALETRTREPPESNSQANRGQTNSMAARKKSKAKKPSDHEALSFEAALERLAGLVDRLEGGDLELEESLGVFEQGVGLSKQCATKLEAAERKVEQLVREGGEWLARPFDAAFEEGEGGHRGERNEFSPKGDEER